MFVSPSFGNLKVGYAEYIREVEETAAGTSQRHVGRTGITKTKSRVVHYLSRIWDGSEDTLSPADVPVQRHSRARPFVVVGAKRG